MKLALLTIECVAADRALRQFVERQGGDVALVVLSHRVGGGRVVAEAVRYLRRSGWRFLVYLAVNFVLCPCAARVLGHLGVPSLARTCRHLDIPVVQVSDINGETAARLIRDHGVDLLICCCFDQILDPATIRLAAGGAVNIHPSPLPAHRGPCPLVHMAADGVSDGAVTLHRIEDRHIDTGPILAQAPVALPPGTTVLGRERRCFEAGADLLSRTFPDLEAASRAARPQGPGSYQSFPDRSTVARARRRGVLLWRFADLAPRS